MEATQPRAVVVDPYEARLFGVLIEKQLTTPDQYPLSLNAATNAANQKSNRNPVLSLSENEVAEAIDRLEQKYLVRRVYSRVERYRHNGKETLGLEFPELAILADLLLRGPQMPGELRTHVSRMQPIESIEQLMDLLNRLMERGFVRRLPPAAGSRAERYVQLISPDLHPLDAQEPTASTLGESPSPGLSLRVEALEMHVQRLQRQLQTLASKLGEGLED